MEGVIGVERDRIHVLNKHPIRIPNDATSSNSQYPPKYVLHWMQASARIHTNQAFLCSSHLANSLGLPLLIVFGLDDNYPEANLRHFTFLLQGLHDVYRQIQSLNTQFLVIQHSPPDLIKALSHHAAAIITDGAYLKLLRQWRRTISEQIECAMFEIETDLVIPIKTASLKEEYSARTLRSKITPLLDQYLKTLPPEPTPLKTPLDLKMATDFIDLASNISTIQFTILLDESIVSSMTSPSECVQNVILKLNNMNKSVADIKWMCGGTQNALQMLDVFLSQKLMSFHTLRNDPGLDKVSSNLSAYLHFGHISPVYIAHQTRAALRKNSKLKGGSESFLEELIIRRELAYNFVYYNPYYDSIKCLPNFALETLNYHNQDKRDYVYSIEELECACTHDVYWNACQNEMLVRGKMHGYMRMYWAKKILEWTESFEIGFKHSLYLNNKYEIDGRGANAFAGVAWAFGKHDQGWAERKVFGKVRYMNAEGLKRKFDVTAYVERISRLVENVGLPESVKELMEKDPDLKKKLAAQNVEKSSGSRKRQSLLFESLQKPKNKKKR